MGFYRVLKDRRNKLRSDLADTHLMDKSGCLGVFLLGVTEQLKFTIYREANACSQLSKNSVKIVRPIGRCIQVFCVIVLRK